jgi:DNA invertase Pin-like site-specific DNA recombinase
MVAALKAGDVVVVNKLDRLGRSTRELLDLIHRIDKAGASFRSLGDPLWDTGSAQGRLLLTVLAAIAEFERELIRGRTGEGRGAPWRTASSSAESQSYQHSSGPRL